jgi:hypothetical protein
VVRMAAEALASVLRDQLSTAVDSITGKATNWGDFRSAVVNAIEATILGIGRLVDELKKALNLFSKGVIRPAANIADRLGVFDQGGTGQSVYATAREEGHGVIISGLAHLGSEVAGGIADAHDSFFGNGGQLREWLDNKMEEDGMMIRPTPGRRVNPLEQLAQGLEAFSGTGGSGVEAAKRFRELAAAVYQASGAAATAAATTTEQMRVSYQVSAKARETANYFNSELAKGDGALAQFNMRMRNIQEAAHGNNAPNGAMAGALGIAAAMGRGWLMTPEQERFAQLRSIEELRQKVGFDKNQERQRPVAAMVGSQEAANIIATQEHTRDALTDLINLMTQAKDIEAETRDYNQRMAEALDYIRDNPGVVGGSP